jgi:hypothetical protein
MRILLRVEDSNPAHVRSRLFLNGRNCGLIVTDHQELAALTAFLSAGINAIGNPEDTFILEERETHDPDS